MEPAFQIDAYVTALTDPLFYRVLFNTIAIGLATAAASVLIAYPFVFILHFVVPRSRPRLSLERVGLDPPLLRQRTGCRARPLAMPPTTWGSRRSSRHPPLGTARNW